MIDLQVIQVRNVLPLRALRALEVVRLLGPFEAVASVQLAGQDAKYVSLADGSLLVVPPHGNYGQNIAKVMHAPGGTSTLVLVDAGQVMGKAILLQASVDDASHTVGVRVNRRLVAFTILGPSTVGCELPRDFQSLDSVEVLSSAKHVSRESFFEYMLPAHAQTLTGVEKLVGQLVKLLMSTPDTDVLHKQEGSGLRALLGSAVPANNTQVLAAVVTRAVEQAVRQLVVSQTGRQVPAAERLASAQVVDLYVPPEDPGSVSLGLRIFTLGQQQALFSLLLGVG